MDVSGTVTDGSGAGWPLYARITITGPGAPAGPVFTDPADGTYGPVSLQAGQSYSFTVEAVVAGYRPQARTGVSHNGASATESFALLIDAPACSAPGYELSTAALFTESFTTSIPASWTVVDNSKVCDAGIDVWSSTDLAPLFPDESTVVTPGFAVINSDACGNATAPQINTGLITPAVNLSSLGSHDSVIISFNSDYRDLCSEDDGDAVSLEIGTFTANTWTNIETLQDFCGLTDRRNRAESFATQAANGVANARFRFHYVSGWDWWWAFDDVRIARGTCTFQGGGLVWGLISDVTTSAPIVGATVGVNNTPAASTTSIATPEDPSVPDGYYALPADTGLRTVTASAPRYQSATGTVSMSSGNLSRLDLALASGILNFSPNPLVSRTSVTGTTTVNGSVANIGPAPGSFILLEINTPAPAGRLDGQPVTGRIDGVPLRLPDEKPFLSALTARDFPARPYTRTFPSPILAGEVSTVFDTDLPGGPYGNGVRQLSPGLIEVWLGNLSAISGPDENRKFTSDKETFLTPAGTPVAPLAAGVFYADMTYNSRTQSYWQVNVGGDNCIHEFKETGFTNAKICPAFATSQRGLAYDVVTDTYYSGSFNDGAIVQFASDGTILRQIAKDVDTVGMAFNPLTCHLFAMQNTASPEVDIVVMDACDPDFAFVNSYDLAGSDGPAMGDFEQAGLDMSCTGQLIANNFVTGQVVVADSGEGSSCPDIPWLSLTPASGTVAPSGSVPVTASFDAVAAGPGCHEAHVLMETDTPEISEVVPVFFTAAFHDVPTSHPFDRFVHALAGAGISNGCGAGNFCPNATITRAQMAVWLLRGKFGADHIPPPATGRVFDDVPSEAFAAEYIEQLFSLGISAGCDSRNFCPNNGVTREQMAVFLLRTLEGPTYVPPPAVGLFTDVPVSSPFARWIEELFRRGITAGCNTTPAQYCPGIPVSRGTMSVFVTVTFDLPRCVPAP